MASQIDPTTKWSQDAQSFLDTVSSAVLDKGDSINRYFSANKIGLTIFATLASDGPDAIVPGTVWTVRRCLEVMALMDNFTNWKMAAIETPAAFPEGVTVAPITREECVVKAA